MFPISDNIALKRFPIVTWFLVAANFYVFWLEFRMGSELQDFIKLYGLVPAQYDRTWPDLIVGGASYFLPFLTSMFLHGGWLHVITNMWSLWLFGDNLEDHLGPLRFLFFYILCGLGAGLTHIVMYPGSEIPVVGASGAIAGVMGAYMLLFPRARLTMFTLLVFYPISFEIPAVVFLVLWFLGQLMSEFAETSMHVAGIAFSAHIGGFVAGMGLLILFRRRRKR